MRKAWIGALVLLLGCSFGSSGDESGGGSNDGTVSTGSQTGDDDDDDAPSTSGGGDQDGDSTAGAQPDTGQTNDDDDLTSTSSGSTTGDDPSTSTSSSTGAPAAFGCADEDGDGAGDPSTCQLDAPEDYVDNDLDCDDGDPYLGPCPSSCNESTAPLSCAGDFEAIDTASQPACPESDLTWDATPGPNQYAVATCQTIMSNWYGHGLDDHTTSAADGNVFYGDLSDNPPVGAAYYREPITVVADTTYMIHLWIKNTTTNEAAATEPTIGLRVDGFDHFDDYVVANYVGDVDTWDEISVLYQADTAGTIDVEVVNWADSIAGPGLDIAIDDVTIVGCD